LTSLFAVMTSDGKLVMESIIGTKASTILQFIQGLHGDLRDIVWCAMNARYFSGRAQQW
jgi:hypothetical protein